MSYQMGVGTAGEYVGKDLICWASYPDEDIPRPFSLYPQIACSDDEFRRVDPFMFPEMGAFTAMPTGDAKQAAILPKEMYGDLVVAHVNTGQFRINDSYNGITIKDRYLTLFNPQLRNSDLALKRFGETEWANKLYQVIQIDANESFTQPFTKPVMLAGEYSYLASKQLLVQQEVAGETCLYGPFVYTDHHDGKVELYSSEAYDYRIYCLPFPGASRFFSVNMRGNDAYTSVCTFVPAKDIELLIAQAEDDAAIDWLPNAKAAELFRRIINASEDLKQLGNSTKNVLKDAIDAYVGFSGLRPSVDAPRKRRLKEIIDTMESDAHYWNDMLTWLVDNIDDERLSVIVTNEDVYPHIKDRLLRSAGVKQRVAEEERSLMGDLDFLRREIDQLEHRADEARQEIKEAQENTALIKERELARYQDEIDDRQHQIDEQKKESLDLEDQIRNLREDRARISADKYAISREVDSIIAGFADEVATSGKILQNEMLRRIVRVMNDENNRQQEQVLYTPHIWQTQDDTMTDAQSVILDIEKKLTDIGGRSVTHQEVINLMTCLMQGYITTFAGMPGTGKSSLCTTLAGALGLLGNDQRPARFTEINVESGWTSYKDYIGYHNPITRSYEAVNPHVFDAMRNLAHEQEKQVPPYVFLLDEANLSPIEHYWSPFLRACDTFMTSGAHITLGRDEDWKLPSHIRFLATVNFDHTTEALSARFLDRSWVITLPAFEPGDVLTGFDPEDSFAGEIPYTYDRLMKIFGPSGIDIVDDQVNSLFNRLLGICTDHGFPVSQRSQLMMRRYIATTSVLMEAHLPEHQYRPLDFAFLQKVLPLIAGPKESVGPLVDELLLECQSLRATVRQLERMKKYGEDSGYYQYFI